MTRSGRLDFNGAARGAYRRLKRLSPRLSGFLDGITDADAIVTRLETHYDVMAYFATSPDSLYQIRQWIRPLEELNRTHPVLILTRGGEQLKALARLTDLPIFNARRTSTIDAVALHGRFKMAVYVNQSQLNFQALRYGGMMHVFLSHGESEKRSYMASNQLKAYDFVFVAGDAAVERIRSSIMNFDTDQRLIKIGRPQLDVTTDVQRDASLNAGRRTVVYAPTWEGDRPSMDYESVRSHGPAIADAVLGSERFRLVYRPHPLTGTIDSNVSRADAAIRARVQVAAQRDPAAGHRVDTTTDFAHILAEADLGIADISAVAVDMLATGTPLAITRPVNPSAIVEDTDLIRAAYPLHAEDLARLPVLLETWLDEDPGKAARAEVVRHYVGDTTPGRATRRFIEACEMVMGLRDELIDRFGTPGWVDPLV